MNFKDEEFNITTVTQLAEDIKAVYRSFDVAHFTSDCVNGFDKLELKERITFVEKQLEKYLTDNYLENVEILSQAMKPVRGGRFIYMSVIEYLERQGCNEEYLDVSLEKLGEFTRLISSEFSIRAFLNTFEDETLAKVYEWTKSSDVHKRRLATEGTRPRIPWAQNISVPYKKAAKVLDNLYYDTERYVTRSCANHLNDISKIDPDFVLETLKRWKKSKKQTDEEMEYIIKHSLRTLIKKGHLDTLVFMGLKLNPDVEVEYITLSSDEVRIGDDLYFEFKIIPKENTELLIDYVVSYPLKSGAISNKVYKIRTFNGKVNEPLILKRKRAMHHMTTRKMNPGTHKVAIQINGSIYKEISFELKV